MSSCIKASLACRRLDDGIDIASGDMAKPEQNKMFNLKFVLNDTEYEDCFSVK